MQINWLKNVLYNGQNMYDDDGDDDEIESLRGTSSGIKKEQSLLWNGGCG